MNASCSARASRNKTSTTFRCDGCRAARARTVPSSKARIDPRLCRAWSEKLPHTSIGTSICARSGVSDAQKASRSGWVRGIAARS